MREMEMVWKSDGDGNGWERNGDGNGQKRDGDDNGDGNGWRRDEDGNGWERCRTKHFTVNLCTGIAPIRNSLHRKYRHQAPGTP